MAPVPRPLVWEFVNGEWHNDDLDRGNPDAFVTHTLVPSPETGHVGWVWWAQGRMGEATSVEDAKLKASVALAAKKGAPR